MMEQQQENPQAKQIEYLRTRLGAAVLYDQLAEECTELAQAALKQSRQIRGINPTKMEQVDIVRNVDEEVNDVLLCLDVLGLSPDIRMSTAKLDRWTKRVEEHEARLKADAAKAMAEMAVEGDTDAGSGPEGQDERQADR